MVLKEFHEFLESVRMCSQHQHSWLGYSGPICGGSTLEVFFEDFQARWGIGEYGEGSAERFKGIGKDDQWFMCWLWGCVGIQIGRSVGICVWISACNRRVCRGIYN